MHVNALTKYTDLHMHTKYIHNTYPNKNNIVYLLPIQYY